MFDSIFQPASATTFDEVVIRLTRTKVDGKPDVLVAEIHKSPVPLS